MANGGQGASSSPGQPFTARTVSITQPNASGACTAQGGGFGGGGIGSGQSPPGGNAPPGNGSGPPGNGQNRNNAPRFAVAFGKVQSLSGSSFVVQGPNRNGSTTTTTTVTTDTSTTYTKVVNASPSALAVGQCIAATGSSDQTGAITANSISIRQAGANGCFAGPGGAGDVAGATPS
jgi:hypothetical protein